MCINRWRIAISCALLLSMLGIAAPSIVEAQSGTATLTIHSRFCPPEYDGTDIFVDCHGTPGQLAIDYWIVGQTDRQMPNEEGNLDFFNLQPGTVRVQNSLPIDGQRPAIYCSPGDGSVATYYEAVSTGDHYSFALDLAKGDAITCDWYTLPESDVLGETASLIVHNRFCPVGYNGSNEYADCHDNVGISYVNYQLIDDVGSRYSMLEGGNAYFYWVGAHRYDLQFEADLPARVTCSDFGKGEPPFLSMTIENSTVYSLPLEVEGTVVCDWYVYPPDSYYRETGAFPVFVATCPSDPGGFAPGELPSQCARAEGVRIVAYPTAGGTDYANECVTNTMGGCDVQVPGPMPLTVEIDETTLPPGYVPLVNPVSTVAYTEFAGARFILIPAAVDKGD